MSREQPDALVAASPVAVFAALGDESRLHLIDRLTAEGPLSIMRLTEGAGLTRQGVTKHLHVLSDAGLVHGQRHGREQIWALTPSGVEAARRYLDLVSREWDETLNRLRVFVEEE